MKIFITKINESWIIDRVKKEFIDYTTFKFCNFIQTADVIWVIAPWSFSVEKIKKHKNKKIIYSIYHIEDRNVNNSEIKEILEVDKYIDYYHVISKETKKILEKLTDKPIYYLPFWVNQNIWYFISDKVPLRKKYNFKSDDFLIGSFQRDTEGSDMKSPKLVKGPDIFINIVKEISSFTPNLRVVLTGTRRSYVIEELQKLNIPYSYFEMADYKITNELYNTLDLYLVTSRLEGGPQALVECGQTKTPIISSNVGIAKEILSPESIFDVNDLKTFKNASSNVDYAYEKSSLLKIPDGIEGYVKMFKEVYES